MIKFSSGAELFMGWMLDEELLGWDPSSHPQLTAEALGGWLDIITLIMIHFSFDRGAQEGLH